MKPNPYSRQTFNRNAIMGQSFQPFIYINTIYVYMWTTWNIVHTYNIFIRYIKDVELIKLYKLNIRLGTIFWSPDQEPIQVILSKNNFAVYQTKLSKLEYNSMKTQSAFEKNKIKSKLYGLGVGGGGGWVVLFWFCFGCLIHMNWNQSCQGH